MSDLGLYNTNTGNLGCPKIIQTSEMVLANVICHKTQHIF